MTHDFNTVTHDLKRVSTSKEPFSAICTLCGFETKKMSDALLECSGTTTSKLDEVIINHVIETPTDSVPALTPEQQRV